MLLHLKDGGVKSRKLWFSLATSVLIFAGAWIATSNEAFRATYDAMVGGLLGSLGLYMGANVGAKHVLKGAAEAPAAAPDASPAAI